MKESTKNAFYAQSGGVTSVINASACGLIEAAREHSDEIATVYAGKSGIIGALTEDLIDTSVESAGEIAALRYTPAGAFGSCRHKLKGLDEDRHEYERLLEVFKAHQIGYFFYNGGGDSADTCHKISQLAEETGFPLKTIHIPKTVDNDLPFTDTCPGFGSVAKYVAVSTREASLDVCSMAESSTKVFVLEVMGRHAGWIAAASGLANHESHPLPLLILFPEVAFDQQNFLVQVKDNVNQHGYCTVVVSEGVRNKQGEFLSNQGAKDAFGHTQLGGVAPTISTMINHAHGYKCHWAVADYLQRSARHIASRTDVEQAYALGKTAVEAALAGESTVMLTIVRKSEQPYTWEIGRVALEKVANVEKKLPERYIGKTGFGITADCKQYLTPLIEGENYPPYKDGLPCYAKLKNTLAEKKLLTPFALK